MGENGVLFFWGLLIIVLAIAALAFALIRKVFPLYRGRRFAYAYWGLSSLLLVLSVFARTDMAKPTAACFMELAVLWFMGQFFAILLLPFYYLVKKFMLRRLQRGEGAADMGRRDFIKGMAVSLPVAALGISAYGTFYSSRAVRLFEYEVKLADLDPGLKGFKIAQISDAHVGLFFSAAKLRDVIGRLREKKADVLVITGDLIDDLAALPAVVEILNEFSASFPKGIYFSWGNHEYFRNFPLVEKFLSGSKARILRNESALLADAAKPLYLIGVDYPWSKDAAAQRAECRRMLGEALAGIEGDATKILLSHHPMLIDYAYEAGIGLSLTGHTHGGQVAFFGQALLPVRYKYMRGMYRQGNQYGYVSAGAGSWFPFRLGCPAEIAVFTLQ